MAKLPNAKFHHKNETGETMAFVSSVTLDQDGTFNVSIPDELEATACSLRYPLQVSIGKPKNANLWRVSGKRLDDCKEFINAAMADYLKCEVITERVIVYGYKLSVCYVKDDNGGLYSNGYSCETANEKGDYGRHAGDFHATNGASLYSVGIGAKVFDRVTYIRASGKMVEYKHPNFPGSHFKLDSPGKMLNSFAGLFIKGGMHGTQDMAYSDEAATFFYDAIIAMCKLADQVKSFLGDPQSLKLAIEGRSNLMLQAPKTEKLEAA